PADRRHRRHGHPVRRLHRQRAVPLRPGLPAGADGAALGRARVGAGGRDPALARSLAALDARALRAVGVLLPDRHRGPAAGAGTGPRRDPGRRAGRRGAAVSTPASPRPRALVRLETGRQAPAGVDRLTLARPATGNALVPDLLLDLCVALEAIARRDDVRAVVLAAEGACFSMGGDLQRFVAEMRGPSLQTY